MKSLIKGYVGGKRLGIAALRGLNFRHFILIFLIWSILMKTLLLYEKFLEMSNGITFHYLVVIATRSKGGKKNLYQRVEAVFEISQTTKLCSTSKGI